MELRDLQLMDLEEQPMGMKHQKVKKATIYIICSATMLHQKKFKGSLGIMDPSAGANVMSLWLKKGKMATSQLEILNQT